MSNYDKLPDPTDRVRKWQIWAWDVGMQRYVKGYIVEFDGRWTADKIREEVVACDRELPDGRNQHGVHETIVAQLKEG